MYFLTKTQRSALALAALASFAISCGASAPAMASPFDGSWAVEIVTEIGECQTGHHLPIEVTGGEASYAGFHRVIVNGGVSQGGEVAISLSYAGDVVEASGAIDDLRGKGRWVSATRECSGRWRATRG